METLEQRIGRHEGYREFEYFDSLGNPTIGIGHLCKKGEYPDGINYVDALKLLDADIKKAKLSIAKEMPWTMGMGAIRFGILVEMVFQLGINGILRFKKMIVALRQQDYDGAADEMLDSDWYEQTPNRCKELAQIMRDGI